MLVQAIHVRLKFGIFILASGSVLGPKVGISFNRACMPAGLGPFSFAFAYEFSLFGFLVHITDSISCVLFEELIL